MTSTLVEANGGPAVLVTGGGRTITLLTVDVDDSGRVTAIHTVANPDKLGAVGGGHGHPLS
jgi:RNA polymerase sigma-70 factor (ECF subfamily)